jgi:hypothetical protein
MDAMHRMLADARSADLEREAQRRRLAAVARGARAGAGAAAPERRWTPPRVALRRLVGLRG